MSNRYKLKIYNYVYILSYQVYLLFFKECQSTLTMFTPQSVVDKKIRFSTLNLLGVSRSRDLLRICSVNCISVQTNSILHCKSRDPNNFQLKYFHHLIIFCFWLIHKLPDKLNFYYELIKTWPNAITDEISLYHIPERIAFVVTMQSNCRRNSPLVTFNSIGGLWTKLAWTMSLQQWCL